MNNALFNLSKLVHSTRLPTASREIMYPLWPKNASGSSQDELENVSGEQDVFFSPGPVALVTCLRISGRKWR